MDQKRLPLFIAISVAILLLFQYVAPRKPQPVLARQAVQSTRSTPSSQTPAPTHDPATPGTQPVHVAVPANAPRAQVDAPRVTGTISLTGARLDDLRLKDYRETVKKTSPLVRVLEPQADPQPSYVQFGWSSTDKVKLPGDDTLWTSSGGTLGVGHPVTLTWDNGAGLIFAIAFSVDDNFMFAVHQSVHNTGSTPLQLWPWERVRREYLPQTAGYSVLFEGVIGVMDDKLEDIGYGKIKSEADKHNDVGYDHTGAGGWAGFTDKYWLTALVPDQAVPMHASWDHWLDDGSDRFQVSYLATDPQNLAPGSTAQFDSRVFAGAKEVHLLDRYEADAMFRC